MLGLPGLLLGAVLGLLDGIVEGLEEGAVAGREGGEAGLAAAPPPVAGLDIFPPPPGEAALGAPADRAAEGWFIRWASSMAGCTKKKIRRNANKYNLWTRLAVFIAQDC
jgi:hypothetical protein